MSCFHPNTIFYLRSPRADGKLYTAYCVTDIDRIRYDDFCKRSGCKLPPLVAGCQIVGNDFYIKNRVLVPCGSCLACRQAKAKEWASRCMMELEEAKKAVFITLTFDDFHFGSKNEIDKRDLQLFFKRLRHLVGSFRYFACGEYGGQSGRKHYHAILFGLGLEDLAISGCVRDGEKPLYLSDFIMQAWPFGFSSVGEADFASILYVARYGQKSLEEKKGGFLMMSRRPGLGVSYFKKHLEEFKDGTVYLAGQVFSVPAYFRTFYERSFDDRLLALADALKERSYVDNAYKFDCRLPKERARDQIERRAYSEISNRGN